MCHDGRRSPNFPSPPATTSSPSGPELEEAIFAWCSRELQLPALFLEWIEVSRPAPCRLPRKSPSAVISDVPSGVLAPGASSGRRRPSGEQVICPLISEKRKPAAAAVCVPRDRRCGWTVRLTSGGNKG